MPKINNKKRNYQILVDSLNSSFSEVARNLDPPLSPQRVNQICVAQVGALRIKYETIPAEAVLNMKNMIANKQAIIDAALSEIEALS